MLNTLLFDITVSSEYMDESQNREMFCEYLAALSSTSIIVGHKFL
jgi:hypothetical protein